MFEAQTYDKVLEEILSRAPDGIDLRQGSIFYDAVAGIAFKIAKYYADLEQVFEMVFLVTATGDYLTLKAEEYAVYRQAAATAKYRIKYDGELPELGTRFFCSVPKLLWEACLPQIAGHIIKCPRSRFFKI